MSDKLKVAVSVILPVYNVAPYLDQCLTSLTKQTLSNIEIICINDGSTDNSLEILHKWAAIDDRIIVINKKNGGLGSARNAGIQVAHGEYLGFVDSDDWVDINYFAELYNAAARSGADIARALTIHSYPDCECDQGGINITICRAAKCKRMLGVNEHSVIVCNAIYKNDFIKRNNILFVEGLIHEDIPFTAQCSCCANYTVPVSSTRYHYRQARPGHLSAFNIRSVRDSIRASAIALKFINSVQGLGSKDKKLAIRHLLWRCDYKFRSALRLADFSTDVQRELFDIIVTMVRSIPENMLCKLRKRLPYIRFALSNDFDGYKKWVDKISLKTVRKKISPMITLEITPTGHKRLRILGIRILTWPC